MKKRLLFICQYFYPEVFRGNDIAFDMARRGVEVTVICGTPNYPKGKIFDGYGIFKRTREKVNGVNIIRIPIVPRGHGSKIQLILNYFSYFINASLFIPFHLLFANKYDACFVQQLSPVMMSVPGVVFRKLTGRKLYTWVLDLWPESLKAAGGINNKRVLSFFEWFSKLEYRNSDTIYVSSKGFTQNIAGKGDFESKIMHLPNWAEDEMRSAELLPLPVEMPEGFNIVFTGNIGEAQDFDSVVEAAKMISPSEGIHFILVGDGRKKDWIEEQIRQYSLEEIIYLAGRHEMKYMPAFFNAADCLLLPLKDDEVMNLTIPAKMQAYMTGGKPIVGMINGEANELINTLGCGIAVEASNPLKLVEAVRQLKSLDSASLREMGEKGKKFCEENYDRTTILNRLYSHIFQ